jgi:hypothetical protein
MLIGMLNLRALRALEIALERCFAAAATLSDGSCGVRESRFVGL